MQIQNPLRFAMGGLCAALLLSVTLAQSPLDPASPNAAPQSPAPIGKGKMGKGKMGQGKMGKGNDPTFVADRDTFHYLLSNHDSIQRTVKLLKNGVETVTESDRPEVAKKIQEHVPAMYERLKSGNGVRYWDPLFAEAFKHGKKMKMEITRTEKGVKVVETSDQPDVVRIIQAHAEVVSRFVKHGFAEAEKEHPVPPIPDKK
ncbi:Uncharacterized protein OS=Planctomyces brasiliensis (strain ATCC 49424 / DSM 5305 / JCM 21570 / NBRC 103401 / IFAM 1448) GN=Plabr_2496 PE=4 SV=1 [Tuwongella immobilis]|uniref:DUF4142 domain-containing protein n=2 Tax=Tuwongella immobilis TaxID=692036 RepID=A0A6C2YI74_9BACT|nr:Uncharacterized protein OS=Planctomyces brasiliensis (strain ATCC 49424 / DSM 5305 / JCM 21570 / NBRC 103401 / IFAM 1448) GN=Plabr_2496 PE=4 SV=1 [Tuwongella immobilis]VTR97902.1 Uncharacterized protein OS=Planctomyces brasiliensis (strain ATCC 49424 / DSM 5305 / JCM 21570 / NBRC 103401 / IFAM 1448) GN=Plabr_2496 PE=4 SV=1 [Tuwongella immobilis]